MRWPVLAAKVVLPLLASVCAAYLLSALLSRREPGGEAGTRRLRAVVLPLPSTRHLPAGLHWLSAGAVGAARGLNDTPKIAAVAGFALLPAGTSAAAIVAGTAVAMAAGALLAGARVARRLGEDVVGLDDRDGLRANLATAALVGPGAAVGLPMSTTHVSTGAIAGVAGADAGRLNLRTLRDFAVAWTLTPVVAGLLAAATYGVL